MAPADNLAKATPAFDTCIAQGHTNRVEAPASQRSVQPGQRLIICRLASGRRGQAIATDHFFLLEYAENVVWPTRSTKCDAEELRGLKRR